jgi:hypothetical protein
MWEVGVDALLGFKGLKLVEMISFFLQKWFGLYGSGLVSQFVVGGRGRERRGGGGQRERKREE